MACAAFYACAPSSSNDGGSSGTSGTSGSSGSDDGAAANDSSTSSDADDAAPTDGSAADAPSDAVVDASADGGTCSPCLTNAILNGKQIPPLGEPQFCKGGCTWVSASYTGNDYHDTCHAKCDPVCAPDPPYAGVCPAACTGGCPGGVCNIICDGSDPSTSCRNTFNEFMQVEQPIVKCPEGLPCKVIGSNDGARWNIIACPRGPVSCEVDCGTSGPGCGRADVYCGEGPCNIHGNITINDGTSAGFPERERAEDVCGSSCKCDLPYPILATNAAGARCQCKDYQRLVGGFPQIVSCPKVCAAHGGWSEPWGRGPNSW